MIALRVALIAALLAVCGVAHGQQVGAADVAPPLRPAVETYRAGDLAAAEAAFRALASSDADAEASAVRGIRPRLEKADKALGVLEGVSRAVVVGEGLGRVPR